MRYRGYVYDYETGLYYLQSRYYNAEVGRFLNHDVVYDIDAGLQGYSLFVYCGNNPIRRVDISGADSVDMVDGEMDEDDPLVTDGCGNGTGCGTPTGNPSGNGNTAQSSYPSSSNGRTEVHHIVEQCQQSKSGFSKESIQADSNKITLPYDVHRRISGYYASVQDFTNGLRVRNWLVGQSFEDQTTFGWSAVDKFYWRKLT